MTIKIPKAAVEAAARELARLDGHNPDELLQDFDRNAHHGAAACGEDYDDPLYPRWQKYTDTATSVAYAALEEMLEQVGWKHPRRGDIAQKGDAYIERRLKTIGYTIPVYTIKQESE